MNTGDHPSADERCDRHGKPLLIEYGIVTGYCEDCEPSEPDGEAFRGHEAVGSLSHQVAEARRLK